VSGARGQRFRGSEVQKFRRSEGQKVRRQRTEDRGQKSEVRRSEVQKIRGAEVKGNRSATKAPKNMNFKSWTGPENTLVFLSMLSCPLSKMSLKESY
jgi:hypothetical protein